MKAYITIILFLVFINPTFSQEFCWFSQEDDIENINDGYRFGNLDFFINGVFIDNTNRKNRIFINEKGLDSIRVINNFDTTSYIIYCKLKSKEKYHIRYNICSAFEIVPKSHDGTFIWKGEELIPKNKGVILNNFVRLIHKSKDEQLYVYDSSWYINKKDYKNNDTTRYYQTYYGASCPHAQSTFTICKTDEKPDYKFLRDTTICLTIRIMFFHSEKYSIIYNGKSNDISLSFDCYFDKQKDKTINANNSIYIAD